MNEYEGIFIIKPDMGEDQIKGAFKSIGDLITKNSGNVKKEENWGKRPLAYPLKKFKDAYYYKLDFTAPPDSIQKLDAAYKLNADILRVMITRR